MLDFQSVIHETIPTVHPVDLERFWHLQSQRPGDSSVSYSIRAISQICGSESADPIATWARTALIRIVLEHDRLEKWRTGDNVQPALFVAAAAFPLPDGLQGIDPEAFVTSLVT